MWLTVRAQQLGAETLSSMEGGTGQRIQGLPGLLVGEKGTAIGLCPGSLFPRSAFLPAAAQALRTPGDLTSMISSISTRVILPSPSRSYMLKAQFSFCSKLPLEVMDSAQMNSRKSMVPSPFLSKVRKACWANLEASPYGKNYRTEHTRSPISRGRIAGPEVKGHHHTLIRGSPRPPGWREGRGQGGQARPLGKGLAQHPRLRTGTGKRSPHASSLSGSSLFPKGEAGDTGL